MFYSHLLDTSYSWLLCVNYWSPVIKWPSCCTCWISVPQTLCGCRHVYFSGWVWGGRWRRWTSPDASEGLSPERREKTWKQNHSHRQHWVVCSLNILTVGSDRSLVQRTSALLPSPRLSCPLILHSSRPVGRHIFFFKSMLHRTAVII